MPTFPAACFAVVFAFFMPAFIAQAEDESPIEIAKASGKVQVLVEGMGIVVDVNDPSGIGRAELRRADKTWPTGWKIRLHLAGLEGFRVIVGKRELHWWVSNGPEGKTHMAQLHEGKESSVTDKSDLWTPVKVVAGKDMKKAFEVTVPAKFLRNSESIELRWIDFYR